MGISYPGIFIAEAFMKCVAESSHYVISRTQVTKNALKRKPPALDLFDVLTNLGERLFESRLFRIKID
jgi:hypothetical protein